MVMGGKTMTMGSKTKVKEKRGGRKKCPEGTKCPYKHEYQHDLEYTHEDDLEANEKSKKVRTKSSGNSGIFTGGGQRLGESKSLRNSFLSNSVNAISSNSNSNSSSSSDPKKLKDQIPRAVIATAASAREANAPSILSNNGAGGCGRDGSGIFCILPHSSESKAFPKIAQNLNGVPSTVSSDSQKRRSSDPPSRCHNDIDSFNGESSNAAQSNRNNANNNHPNDEKTRKGMEVINLDSDDEDDEIVFLGQTDNNSNNINSRSNYSRDSNDYFSTGASISSSNSNSSSSNNSDYISGRRESYPEIISINSRGQNSGINTNPRRNYTSDSIFYSTGASIPSSSSSSNNNNPDHYSGRRESYPEIININSRGQENYSNSINNGSNQRSDHYSIDASMPSNLSIYSDHNSGRRESYPEIISASSKGHTDKGKDPTKSYSGGSSAGDDSNGLYFDNYDTRSAFDNSNGKRHSSSSSFTANKTPSSSLSSPVLADEMLKVICEICSKRVSRGNY
jgi:hypothetical protein